MGAIHTTGPNECLVISGGCLGGQTNKRFLIGGYAFAWTLLTDVQYLPLEVITVHPKCERVLSSEGVPLNVTGVAQIKIISHREFLEKAAEQFLGKTKQQISEAVIHTLEGHLRAILGTLTAEEVYQDRHKFAELVRKVASPDVSKMGIDVISFVIKEVSDDVTYLDSLGKTQTAIVKRDARIGVAESNRDAGIREAECDRLLADGRFAADINIADAQREFRVKEAEFHTEIHTKKADAKLAYELQGAKTTQKVRAEEVAIEVVETRKRIDVEEKEILRREKELQATIQLPATAEAYKIEQLAEGARRQKIAYATGQAEKIKLLGEASASAIEAVGSAEAEGMRLKANAYKQYGDAATISLVLKSLPTIAAQVSAPLSKVDEIVMVGDDKTTAEVSKLVSQLPPAVQALTGVDLSKVLSQIPGSA